MRLWPPFHRQYRTETPKRGKRAITAIDYTQIAECRPRNTASASVARKKLHVDWPQHFCSGTSTSVDYDKLDLAGFVAGYLARIKTYEPETFKFMLSHIEPLMLKGISYTQSSVRFFHANIKKQVELYRLEWNDAADICDRASTFF